MVSASLGLVYATEFLPRTLLLLSMHSTSCPASMEKTCQTLTDFAFVGQNKHQTLQQDAAVQNISPKPLETWSSHRNSFPRESFKSKAAFLLPGDGLSGRGLWRERGSCTLSRCWGTELGPWTPHEKASGKIHKWRACLWEMPMNICGWRGRDGESEPPPAVAPWLWGIPWFFLRCAILEASGDLALLPGNRALLNHTAASTSSTHIISLLCQEQGSFNPHTYIMHPFFA